MEGHSRSQAPAHKRLVKEHGFHSEWVAKVVEGVERGVRWQHCHFRTVLSGMVVTSYLWLLELVKII